MQNRLVLGVACVIFGALVFSLQDIVIKAVSGTYPVTEALALRALTAMPILLVLVRAESGMSALLSRRGWLMILRASLQFASYTCYYLAIAAMPLADVVALFFTTPLMILLLAGPYLGERVRLQTLMSALVGLAGVLVMLRPGEGVINPAALLALASAALYALSQLMSRRLSDTESASVMTFYQNAVYLVGSLAVAGLFMAVDVHSTHPSVQFLTRPWVWPALGDFLMMASCGVIAAAGMLLLTQAYRLAPANRIATFEYAGVLWSPIWGVLFFAEVPHRTTLLGAALIVGAGILALNAGRGRLGGRMPEAA